MENSELVSSGHRACQGCGALVGLRMILETLGPDTALVVPACCASIYSGLFPFSALKVPVAHTPFASAAATASGISRMLKRRNRPGTVMCWGGDGGTLDIGFQALSGACERNENIIYVCYDNEAYMNTGIQRSSATPYGAWTATTPLPFKKAENKKDIDAILAAHKIPLVATVNPAFPGDLSEKLAKAKAIKGMRFIHMYSPCPPGWKYDARYSIKIARLATQTCVFPLFEVENGAWKINYDPANGKLPARDYFHPPGEHKQDRFAHLTDEDLVLIQKNIDEAWASLKKRAALPA